LFDGFGDGGGVNDFSAFGGSGIDPPPKEAPPEEIKQPSNDFGGFEGMNANSFGFDPKPAA